MTTAIAGDPKVTVTCPTCRHEMCVTHEQLRTACDDGTPIPCPVCAARDAPKPTMPLTAAEGVLLAALVLHSIRRLHGEPTEFSEWELTVAAWQCDPNRFGLRGYADRHPDHKRVSMEIMGQKTSSPVVQGFMVKVRPNYYRLTAAGVARAEVIRKSARKGRGK